MVAPVLVALATLIYGCVGSVGAVLIANALDAPITGIFGAILLGTIIGRALGAIAERP